MDAEEKAKWLKRAEFKRKWLVAGSIRDLSGTKLNLAVGLPKFAEWKESNFA